MHLCTNINTKLKKILNQSVITLVAWIFDTTFISTSNNSEETVFTPSFTPTVLYFPVSSTVFFTITNKCNSVSTHVWSPCVFIDTWWVNFEIKVYWESSLNVTICIKSILDWVYACTNIWVITSFNEFWECTTIITFCWTVSCCTITWFIWYTADWDITSFL